MFLLFAAEFLFSPIGWSFGSNWSKTGFAFSLFGIGRLLCVINAAGPHLFWLFVGD